MPQRQRGECDERYFTLEQSLVLHSGSRVSPVHVQQSTTSKDERERGDGTGKGVDERETQKVLK